MILNKFESFWANWKEDRRLINVLKMGTTSPFLVDDGVDYEGEGYSKEELLFMGIKVTKNKKLIKMTADDIAKEYNHFQRKRSLTEANFCVLVYFDYLSKVTIYRKYVKFSDQKWRTLNALHLPIVQEPVRFQKQDQILMFKI